MVSANEIGYNIDASAMDMAEAMFGTGIQIVGATYSGSTIRLAHI